MRAAALVVVLLIAIPGLALLALACIALAPALWLSWIVAREWWEAL